MNFFYLIFLITFYMNWGVKSQQDLRSPCSSNCTFLHECPSAHFAFLKNKTQPSICYFEENRNLPHICCPQQKQKTCPTSPISTQSRITFGYVAEPEDFEFMVGLSWSTSFGDYYGCGGTLIHKLYVLTAAHCLYNNGSYNPLRYAIVGGGSIKNGNMPIRIVSVFQHPDYHPQKKYHDIAILKLAKEVNYQPACIPSPQYELLPETEVVAAGYGKTSFYGDISDRLLRADLKIYRQYNCSQYYGVLLDSQLCVLADLATIDGKRGYSDTCQGDSGGPLVKMDSDSSIQSVVVGIVSFGFPCGNGYPGVYTKVSSYYDWIMEKISK